MEPDLLKIRGARQHNLKNLSLDLPRNALVVVTGLSGSGKSSLAFDTIYAEGQRRYVESLSAYARQFLEQMDRPEVDVIEGLSPAVAIEQKGTGRNPRSTVGTVTEIHDYLRLLYARIGQSFCPTCGVPIGGRSVEQIVDQVLALETGTRIQVLAPLEEGRKGSFQRLFEQLRKEGFTRVRVDGTVFSLEDPIPLDGKRRHTLAVVIDRLVLKEGLTLRLTDSVELALRTGNGQVLVDVEGREDRLFSQKAACPRCGSGFPELTPQMFSFNSPKGACTTCGGLGVRQVFDPDLVVPDPGISLREGAVVPWPSKEQGYYLQMLEAVCRHYDADPALPFGRLPKRVQEALLGGTGEEEIAFHLAKEDRSHTFRRPFEGVIPNLERRYAETASGAIREGIEAYMSVRPCPDCNGRRLQPISLAVRVAGLTIDAVGAMPIGEAHAFFLEIPLGARERIIAERVLREIRSRLGFLESVGLSYLTLDRPAATLSGGEGQRIRLATQISSGLAGVLYVLDEPSIGLHQRDNLRLIENLRRLQRSGNTVLVVEHDAETILAADHVLDLGPGAGEHGGEIVFQGSPEALLRSEGSLTGAYLSGRRGIPVPAKRRAGNGLALRIEGASENNLKEITVEIPLGALTCVTGVSGSGKSTLVNEILFPALKRHLYRSRERVGKVSAVRGMELLDKVIDIDQSPIGRTPRSNPATYTGVFGGIRDLFAMLPEARARGYGTGRFSFNVAGGRCETCKGEGVLRIGMHFLPDVLVTCEACRGTRFNRDTLEVRYKGHSIAEILDMTVQQACGLFGNLPALRQRLQTLVEVGLGYIRLGQSAVTLSGGEAQRVKLSRELGRRGSGRTLYLLDEPTTGLHFEDIRRLLEVLTRLVEEGNTVVVIEHNLDVVKTADLVIDLGPEGGDLGGRVVAAGTPEAVALAPDSHTGRFLAPLLAPREGPSGSPLSITDRRP